MLNLNSVANFIICIINLIIIDEAICVDKKWFTGDSANLVLG